MSAACLHRRTTGVRQKNAGADLRLRRVLAVRECQFAQLDRLTHGDFARFELFCFRQ